MTLRLGPIGQLARPARDVHAMAAWFTGVLGVPHLFTFGDLVFLDCGGVRLFISPAPDGGGPQPLLYLRVDDIEATHAELLARGVSFLQAPRLVHRHDSGLEEWMAFFEDPEGNPIAIMSQVSGTA